ncbi:hypothetical protein ON010_g4437 [Phytophthora cinnamomi]|nr:hypothetical protein ON010_g4437 [Phytophthora cinnamomi]
MGTADFSPANSHCETELRSLRLVGIFLPARAASLFPASCRQDSLLEQVAPAARRGQTCRLTIAERPVSERGESLVSWSKLEPVTKDRLGCFSDDDPCISLLLRYTNSSHCEDRRRLAATCMQAATEVMGGLNIDRGQHQHTAWDRLMFRKSELGGPTTRWKVAASRHHAANCGTEVQAPHGAPALVLPALGGCVSGLGVYARLDASASRRLQVEREANPMDILARNARVDSASFAGKFHSLSRKVTHAPPPSSAHPPAGSLADSPASGEDNFTLTARWSAPAPRTCAPGVAAAAVAAHLTPGRQNHLVPALHGAVRANVGRRRVPGRGVPAPDDRQGRTPRRDRAEPRELGAQRAHRQEGAQVPDKNPRHAFLPGQSRLETAETVSPSMLLDKREPSGASSSASIALTRDPSASAIMNQA